MLFYCHIFKNKLTVALVVCDILCMLFEASSGRSVFSADNDKCLCHVQTLLEPPRRPVSSLVGSTPVASASGQRPVDRNVAKMNGTSVAGSLIHGIASRLRARSASAKYTQSDNDDTDADDICNKDYDTNSVAQLDDDDEDREMSDVDDECAEKLAADKYDGANSPDMLNDGLGIRESLGMDQIELDDDSIDGSDTSSDTDDGEWNPTDADWNPADDAERNRRKPIRQALVKRTKPPVSRRVKPRIDPVLDDALNARRNDGSACDIPTVRRSRHTVDIRKAQEITSFTPKSLKNKLKHGAKKAVRKIRSKKGPKWEKKVGLFVKVLLRHYCFFCRS